MIRATWKDIGRRVYLEHDNNGPVEHGVLTSLLGDGPQVFVLYEGDEHATLTHSDWLQWDDGAEARTG